MPSFEQDQQLFADTLVQIQVHSILAKEHVQKNKSPLPLLAKSCSILDNLPSTCQLTETQFRLLSSLKIDAWSAFADSCMESNDLIQAEASLQRLATLQESQSGPLAWRTTATTTKQKRQSPQSTTTSMMTKTAKTATTTTNVAEGLPEEATKEQTAMAVLLMGTWGKLLQVYSDMGKQDLAKNMGRRIEKMHNRIQLQPQKNTLR